MLCPEDIRPQLTNHPFCVLTSRGNTAILLALRIAKNQGKDTVLLQDQGGWITYKQYAKRLKINIIEVKTEYGVLDLKDLKIKTRTCKGTGVLLFTNPAGYLADQPLKEIADICKQTDTLTIMDVSGSVGTKYADASMCDLMLSSFNRWKPINLGHGGFLSSSNPIPDITYKEMDKERVDDLKAKLKDLDKRYELFEKHRKKIMNDLKTFTLLHKDRFGLNVIAKYKNNEEKQKLISYCEDNGYEWTECPRSIRVLDDAISIEVKRL